MRKLSAILLASLLMGNIAFAAENGASSSQAPSAASEIQWYANFDEATKVAEANGLPLVLFFTGSDWCTWCTKLEEEALHKADFASRTADKFVFVKLDFPMHHPLEPRLASQNQQLKKKYNISGFPSIVVVDAKGNRIGSSGYRQGGASRYADHLLAMVGSFTKHQSTMKDLGRSNLPHEELKELYVKARDLGQNQEATAILENGLKSDRDNFFLLEKYRSVIEEGDANGKDAIRLRDRLLNVAEDKMMRANHDVAVVEFQVLQGKMKKEKLTPAAVATPLVYYIEKHGFNDPEVWKINMAISQLYLEAGQRESALSYAQQALASAPTKVRPDIDNAVHYINSQIHKPKN
ncbi:MAG: thioredoxin family protein [Chlamydiales bacterium]|nr:thioredoxin family protein [Chlamydiales bacterium]